MNADMPKYDRIDLADEANLRYWADEFALSADALQAYVHQFGTDPGVIRSQIEGSPRDRVRPEAEYPFDPLAKPHRG